MAAPVRVKPLPVTVQVPTFAEAKVAVPPVRLTASVPMIVPASVRVAIVAAVVPSYTLILAVKLGASGSGLMARVPATNVIA